MRTAELATMKLPRPSVIARAQRPLQPPKASAPPLEPFSRVLATSAAPRRRPDHDRPREPAPRRDREKAAPAADRETPASLVDPAVRVAAQLSPPTTSAPAPISSTADVAATTRTAELQAVATALVEKAAFWGDGQRGVARLRFGRDARGGLAGATVVLASDGDTITLRLEGVDDATRAALAARLRQAGVTLDD